MVFVTNVNEEASEEDLHDHFAECGKVQVSQRTMLMGHADHACL